jgi:hypothetical protein
MHLLGCCAALVAFMNEALSAWLRFASFIIIMLVDYGVMVEALYNFRHFIINDESCSMNVA